MSSPSPLSLLTGIQTDILGSYFPPSPPCLQSPQPSQVSPSTVESPELDYFWNDPFLCANDILTEPEFEAISPSFLGGQVVDRLSVSTDRRFR